MTVDPFSFIVGQIISAAVQENDRNDHPAQREKQIVDSMAGFVWLKAWRIAHPAEYRDAKLLSIDYSHLKRTPARGKRRDEPGLSEQDKTALNAYYDACIAAKESFTHNPGAWKWTGIEKLLAIARHQHAKGQSYASFLEEFVGARDFISKSGANNALRAIWGLEPWVHWSKESALALAKEVKVVGGTRADFTAKHPNAYGYLKEHHHLTSLNAILPKRGWTIAKALELAQEVKDGGGTKTDYCERYGGAYNYVRRCGMLPKLLEVFGARVRRSERNGDPIPFANKD